MLLRSDQSGKAPDSCLLSHPSLHASLLADDYGYGNLGSGSAQHLARKQRKHIFGLAIVVSHRIPAEHVSQANLEHSDKRERCIKQCQRIPYEPELVSHR